MIQQARNRSVLRFGVLCGAYSIGLLCCLWLAWQLRFDFEIPVEHRGAMWLTLAWMLPVKLGLLAGFRQFSGLLTFFGIRDLFRVFGAIAGSSFAVYLVRFLIDASITMTPPRGVIFIDFVLSFMGLAGLRLLLRLYRERSAYGEHDDLRNRRRVAIIGAGHVGGNLVRELFTRRGLGMKPVYFFDDNPNKWQSRVHDIPIVGTPEMLLEEQFRNSVDEVIITIPDRKSVV